MWQDVPVLHSQFVSYLVEHSQVGVVSRLDKRVENDCHLIEFESVIGHHLY